MLISIWDKFSEFVLGTFENLGFEKMNVENLSLVSQH